MGTFDLPLREFTASTLDQLVDQKTLEGLQLEYKEQLPTQATRDKFLTSVGSFANKAGGDLIYGVRGKRDEEGTPTGEPENIIGLPNVNLDQEKLRLHQWVQDNIEPPPTVFIEVISREPKPACLLIRVMASWSEVHMVKTIGNPFYGRNSGGKYRLSRTEIRDAFLMRQTARDVVRQYRNERIALIKAGNAPAYMGAGPVIIFNALPVNPDEKFWDRFRYLEGESVVNQGSILGVIPLQLICGYVENWHYNADGFVLKIERGNNAYLQVFRDGGIEALDTKLVSESSILLINIERGIIKVFKGYHGFCQRLGIGTPILLSLALAGANGHLIDFTYANPGLKAMTVDRDLLIAPDVVVDDFSIPADKILKPLFDYFWNAGGFPESLHYKNDQWVGDK